MSKRRNISPDGTVVEYDVDDGVDDRATGCADHHDECDCGEPVRRLSMETVIREAVRRYRLPDMDDDEIADLVVRALRGHGYLRDDPNFTFIMPVSRNETRSLSAVHDEVCACPFDGSDPDCNLTMNGAQLAVFAASEEQP